MDAHDALGQRLLPVAPAQPTHRQALPRELLDAIPATAGDRLEGRNVFVGEVMRLRALQHQYAELLPEEDQGHAHLRPCLYEARHIVRHKGYFVLDHCFAELQSAHSHPGTCRKRCSPSQDRS